MSMVRAQLRRRKRRLGDDATPFVSSLYLDGHFPAGRYHTESVVELVEVSGFKASRDALIGDDCELIPHHRRPAVRAHARSKLNARLWRFARLLEQAGEVADRILAMDRRTDELDETYGEMASYIRADVRAAAATAVLWSGVIESNLYPHDEGGVP